MASPTIALILKVQAPVYVRKLRKASDWEHSTYTLEERAQTAVQQIFRNQSEQEISIYLVETDVDLRRIAVGMNANRDSLKEVIDFLAFMPSELDSAGIENPVKTPGDLKCDYANALHYDMTASDEQLAILCTHLLEANRESARCTKGTMKEAERLTIEEKCKSAPGIIQCSVATCSGNMPNEGNP